MKKLSIVLTVLLILPIGYIVFHIYEMRLSLSKFGSPHFTNVSTWRSLSYLLVDVFFIIIASILNFKKRYLENSIMCGTLLVSFILTLIITFTTSFLINWLK